MRVLFEGGQCFIVLCHVANLLKSIFTFAVFFLEKLFLQLLNVFAYILKHATDVELIIGKIVNKDSFFSCSTMGSLAMLLSFLADCNIFIIIFGDSAQLIFHWLFVSFFFSIQLIIKVVFFTES